MFRFIRPSVLGLMFLIAALPACQGGKKLSDADILVIGQTRLAQLRQRPPRKGLVLVDARQPHEFAAGHIPGAINIPLQDVREADPRLAAAGAVVIYGAGPGSPVSPAAAKKLLGLGYESVYDYRGGLEAWQAAGGEVAAADN